MMKFLEFLKWDKSPYFDVKKVLGYKLSFKGLKIKHRLATSSQGQKNPLSYFGEWENKLSLNKSSPTTKEIVCHI